VCRNDERGEGDGKMLSQEHARRVHAELKETTRVIGIEKAKKCFDQWQQAEKDARVAFLEGHLVKLYEMATKGN
jgi:hypothetical protein